MDTIEELKAIEALLTEFYTPSKISIWWSAQQRRFDGKSALQLVEDGRAGELLQALKQMDEAVFL